MTDLRSIAPTVAEILGIPVPSGAEGAPIAEVLDTLPSAEKIGLVILDGFGSSLWGSLEGVVPTMNRLAGLHCEEIFSVRPTLTYVCISSILTGMSPSAHGVTDLKEAVEVVQSGQIETLFGTARRAGRRTMLAAHREGVGDLPLSQFVDDLIIAEGNEDAQLYAQVPNVLRRVKPNLAFVHLIDIDEAAHKWGPYSVQVKEVAARMDRSLDGLLRAFAEAKNAVILLADHGVHEEQGDPNLGSHDGSVEEDLLVPLIWASREELQAIYLK